MHEEDDLDVWPAFVDVLTSAVMFLVLGFVALAIGQIHAQREKQQREIAARRDRVVRDSERAREVGDPVKIELHGVVSAVDGAGCDRKGWEVVCTFRDRLTFDSGQWVLRSEEPRRLLRAFGKSVKRYIDQDQVSEVIVEGHTDPVPMVTRGMTNWELSSARAGHIVQLLRADAGIPGEKLTALGYAEFKPPEGAITNEQKRFVAIRVKLRGSQLAAEEKAP